MNIHLLPDQPACMRWLDLRPAGKRKKKSRHAKKYITSTPADEKTDEFCEDFGVERHLKELLERKDQLTVKIQTKTTTKSTSTANKYNATSFIHRKTLQTLVPLSQLSLQRQSALPTPVDLNKTQFKYPFRRKRETWDGALPRNTQKLVKITLHLAGGFCAYAVANLISDSRVYLPTAKSGTHNLPPPKKPVLENNYDLLTVTSNNKVHTHVTNSCKKRPFMKGRLFQCRQGEATLKSKNSYESHSEFVLAPMTIETQSDTTDVFNHMDLYTTIKSAMLVSKMNNNISQDLFLVDCIVRVTSAVLVVCCCGLRNQIMFLEKSSNDNISGDISFIDCNVGTAKLRIVNKYKDDSSRVVCVTQYDQNLPSQPLINDYGSSPKQVGDKLIEACRNTGWNCSKGDLRLCLSLPSMTSGVSALRSSYCGQVRQWNMSYSMSELAGCLSKKRSLPIVSGGIEHLMTVNLRMELIYCQILKELLCTSSGLTSLLSLIVSDCLSFFSSKQQPPHPNGHIATVLRGVEESFLSLSVWQVGPHNKRELPFGMQLVLTPQFQQPDDDLPRPMRIYRKITPPPIVVEQAINNRTREAGRLGIGFKQKPSRSPKGSSRLRIRNGSEKYFRCNRLLDNTAHCADSFY